MTPKQSSEFGLLTCKATQLEIRQRQPNLTPKELMEKEQDVFPVLQGAFAHGHSKRADAFEEIDAEHAQQRRYFRGKLETGERRLPSHASRSSPRNFRTLKLRPATGCFFPRTATSWSSTRKCKIEISFMANSTESLSKGLEGIVLLRKRA